MILFESILYPDKETLELFNKYKDLVIPDDSIEDLIKSCRGFFFKVYVDSFFKGCIYIHNWKEINNKWESAYLSGFSKPKNQLNTVKAVNYICQKIAEDYGIKEIFSKTDHKHAVICLKRSGFKLYKDNIYRKGL